MQATSVHMWVSASCASKEGRVFHYRMPTAQQCFVLGVSSPHMLQQAARLAHGKPLVRDATFGMNDHKVLSPAPSPSDATDATDPHVRGPRSERHQAAPQLCLTHALLTRSIRSSFCWRWTTLAMGTQLPSA